MLASCALLMDPRYAARLPEVNHWSGFGAPPPCKCDTEARVSRRWIWIAVVLAIGAAALAMLGDVRELPTRLGGFRGAAFVAALGLALGNYTIRCARWALYFRRQAVRVPARAGALVFGAGLSLSITPGKVGDLIKSYLLRELHGVPATRTAPIVVAERVTDLVALLVLAVAGVAAYGVATTAAATA